jgi:hypothetical protein
MDNREDITTALIVSIRSFLRDMTDEGRYTIFEKIMDGYCPLCGSDHLPCYCSPVYDI